LQYFHAPLRDGGQGDYQAAKGNMDPYVSQSRVWPRVWGGQGRPGRHPGPGVVAGPGLIEYGYATVPVNPPRGADGTAEPNLTYGTAAAKAPADKVVLGRGAVRQSRATLLSPPVFPRAGPSHQGIKRRIWCKTGCRGERVPGVQGRAGAPATGSANPNRTYWKGGRLGAPPPRPGHPSHAPLASSPKCSPRQEQSTPGKNDPGGDGTKGTRGPAITTVGRDAASPMGIRHKTPPQRGQRALPCRLRWRLNRRSSGEVFYSSEKALGY
jgi:hypothetical protein